MLKVKKVIRGVKESVLDYDDVQRRIRAATSNDPVGPDSRELSRLAHDTHNRVSYNSLFTIFWKRLTDLQQPSHIVKALIVSEYLLVHGNERFVRDMRSRQRVLKRLTGYVFYRNSEDVGAEVRHRSRDVLKLTLSDELLESRRKQVETAVNKGEPQRYERAYGAGEYNMQSPRQQQQLQHHQHHHQHHQHSFDANFADDPLSSPSFSESSDHQRRHQQQHQQRQRQLAASPFDDPAFEEVAHQRRPSVKKNKHDKEKKKKKKKEKERLARKANKREKNADTGRQRAPAADLDEEEEEDVRTRQLQRAMAGVDAFASSEYEPTSANVSQAPVDFLTGDNTNVISTNWVSDMDFSRAQAPESDASAFFQTSTSDGLGTMEQDGFAFDDALEIDSDDALDDNANTGTSFWDSHGTLTDVSDLRANEYTAKKASVMPAKKRGALTLQQIAQKNAVEEANALSIRPAAGSSISVPYSPSAHSQMQPQQPQLQLQQQPYHHHHHQQQQMYSGALMPYGTAPPMHQQQQPQQYAMMPYSQPPPPMAGYGMGMAPSLMPPPPPQQQQQQQQMDPFNSLGRKGSLNMWQHM